MNNNSKALKSGIWYTISNFIVKTLAFITTPIFTRLLSQNEFGKYNNYTSWLSVAMIFVTLNLESTLISAKYDYKDELDKYIFSMLSLSGFVVILWITVVGLFKTQFSNFLGMEYEYINIMLIYLLFFPAVNMFQTRERYFFEYKKTIATALTIVFTTTGLSVVLVLFMDDRLLGRTLGSVIPTIILGLIFYVYFAIKGSRPKLEHWKYAFPICLPFIPHLLSLTLLNATDRIMIDKWCGSEATALYSLAYVCGTMINLFMISLNSAFAPWLGVKLAENKYCEIRKFSKKYILAFLSLSIGVMLVAPEVLLILGGKGYVTAIYVLAPVSIGCVYQFLYTMFVNVEQFKKRTIGMAIGSIVAASLNFVLNILLIPRFGYLAAAYTTLVGYLCLLSIHMYLVKRLGLSQIYDYKFIGAVVLVGIAVMALITILYSHAILRYITVVIYGCIVLYVVSKYKKQLIYLLKNRS